MDVQVPPVPLTAPLKTGLQEAGPLQSHSKYLSQETATAIHWETNIQEAFKQHFLLQAAIYNLI